VQRLLGKNYRLIKEKKMISYGKGKVIYFPWPVYPADESIRDSYSETIKREAENLSKEQWNNGWITPDNKTSFTVWDDEKRRTIYLLNIDWSTPENNSGAVFHFGDYTFDIKNRSYETEVIHIKDGMAIMPAANTTDILSVTYSEDGWLVKLQTTGKDRFSWFNGLNGLTGQLDIREAGIHTFKIAR
jgi:hypothetical protein